MTHNKPPPPQTNPQHCNLALQTCKTYLHLCDLTLQISRLYPHNSDLALQIYKPYPLICDNPK